VCVFVQTRNQQKGDGKWHIAATGDQHVGILYILRCDTIHEFNVDSKAECGQLNVAHVARNKKV